jgi:hypothetical protein
MRKAFVILTNGATAEQQETIKSLFQGWGWFHHLPQAWILIDPFGTATATAVRDSVYKACPTLTQFVIEVKPGSDWATCSPVFMHEWMLVEWPRT